MQNISENAERGVPKKEYVIFTFILSIVTLGLYNFIWYLKNSPRLNRLNTKTKLKKPLAIISFTFYLLYIIILGLFATYITTNAGSFSIASSISQVPLIFQIALYIEALLSVILIILYLILGFKTRKILNQAIINKGETKKLSGFLTFIFNLYYLQYEINRIIKDKEDKRRIAPWFIFIFLLIIGILVPILLLYLAILSLSELLNLLKGIIPVQ